MEEVELECECGDISASQEDILARSSFLGGGGGGSGEEEEEVQQSQQGQGEQEEDAITMCTLPITQHSPSSPEEEAEEPRKPRICTRKVRGARDVDPLYKAVLMIPSAPAPTSTRDLLALARQRGIF